MPCIRTHIWPSVLSRRGNHFGHGDVQGVVQLQRHIDSSDHKESIVELHEKMVMNAGYYAADALSFTVLRANRPVVAPWKKSEAFLRCGKVICATFICEYVVLGGTKNNIYLIFPLIINKLNFRKLKHAVSAIRWNPPLDECHANASGVSAAGLPGSWICRCRSLDSSCRLVDLLSQRPCRDVHSLEALRAGRPVRSLAMPAPVSARHTQNPYFSAL